MRRIFVFVLVGACGGGVVSSGDGGPSGGSGITCGSASCKVGMEMCCVQTGGPSCVSGVTGDCSGQAIRLTCDDKEDCGSGSPCCFTDGLSSTQAATACVVNGCGAGMLRVCKKSDDCQGTPCNTFTCSAGTGSITLGLCTTTAPMSCK